MDVIQKATKTVEDWNGVTSHSELLNKGDYDGHPFRGNAYVDEFYNPRPEYQIQLSNPFKRKKKKKKKNGIGLDDETESNSENPKTESVEKARRKKVYDEDFEGNQWVDEDGNPQPGAPLGGGGKKKGKKDRKVGLITPQSQAEDVGKIRRALSAAGLKVALDPKGKLVIVSSHRRFGVAESKRNKQGDRQVRYKAPEFVFGPKQTKKSAVSKAYRVLGKAMVYSGERISYGPR